MFKILALSAVVAVVYAGGPHPDAGPHGPYKEGTCSALGELHVDKRNMCWYHECVYDDYGLRMLPRRCALGSKVSYNYITGFSNPCTVRMPGDIGYECMRTQESYDGPPPCFDDIVCQNNGVKTYEADRCWCFCPPEWQGDWDCSKPTIDPATLNLPAASNICVGGDPLDDWCVKAGGCLNGGSCYNQCDTFYCLCPDHEHYNYVGKRCEDMIMNGGSDNGNANPDSTDAPAYTDAATDAPAYTDAATDAPAYTDAATDGPVYTDAATDGPIYTDAATDGPVYTDAATDAPVYTDAATDAPVYTDAATDAPVYTDAATDAPVYTDAATDAPVYTDAATDAPVYTDAATDGPVYTDAATDAPVYTDAATDAPVYTDAATDAPVYTDAATDGPVYTDAATDGGEYTESSSTASTTAYTDSTAATTAEEEVPY